MGFVLKLYLKWPLTTRPIVKGNVLVCADSVLIISDDVLVSVVRLEVINELLELERRIIIVLPNRCSFVNVPGFCQNSTF